MKHLRNNSPAIMHWPNNGVLLLIALLWITLFATSCKKTFQEQAAGPTIETQSLQASQKTSGNIGINVLLNTPVSTALLNRLASYGHVIKVFTDIKALTMNIESSNLQAIKKLDFVIAANPDAQRKGSPTDAVEATNFTDGINTWNLDAVNVTDSGKGRTIAQDGTGVFVGMLDTGLPDSWRQYFPQERIATQYAKSFGGGGGEMGNVSEQPNKWEHDQNGHGGHVTSTIIGYSFFGTKINGVAPGSTIIPVKVLNQNGSGWSSVESEGILYIAGLKKGPLHNSPVVINLSLGGPDIDALEKASIDYAISQGVIIVAAAGNEGALGMSYPGAYAPVISVAAAGWIKEFSTPTWWRALDVPDPTNTADFYIADFSSRQKTGQDLDVTAPGVYVVGPFQTNSGQLSYYYLSGTSMATPHVTGIVALMAQKKPALNATQAETILESTALPMAAGPAAAGSGFVTASAALNAL